jgi:hypothetical protein
MKSLARPELLCWLCLVQPLIGSSAAQEPQPQKPPDHSQAKIPAAVTAMKPLQADPKDDELRKLLKARFNEALGELKGRYAYTELFSKHGVMVLGAPDDLYRPWQRLVQAGLEAYEEKADKIALLTQYLEVTKQREKIDEERYDKRGGAGFDLHRARYERLDAEIRLLRVKEGTTGK